MRIADGPVVLVSSPICHQVAVSGSPLHRQGSVFGPRGCSSRAPHSPICRQRGVLSGPREGEPLISTRLSVPKVTHPDEGGAHRRPRTPQADRPPHPTRSWAAAPGPPHCPRAGMGVAAGPLQSISRDAGARNASIPKRRSSLAPFRSPSGFHSRMAVERPLSCRQRNRRTQSKAEPSVQLHLVSPCGTDLTPPHQPSSVTLLITGYQSSPAGRAVGAPVIELSTRSTAFHCLALLDARESHTSLDFLHRRVGAFRLCLVPVHSVPSSVRLPRIDAAPSEGNSAGAAGCLRRGRTLATVRFRLVVAHRSRGSHLQQSRPRPPGHTSFVAQISLGDPPPLRLGGLEAVT